MEKKNVVVGAIVIFLFLLLGIVLQMKMHAGEQWKQSMMHHLWKTAHLHGLGFGILNVLYGLVVGRFQLKGKATTTGGVLAIIGGIIFPIGLFLGGIMPAFLKLLSIGAFSMLLAWAIITFVLIKKNRGQAVP